MKRESSCRCLFLRRLFISNVSSEGQKRSAVIATSCHQICWMRWTKGSLYLDGSVHSFVPRCPIKVIYQYLTSLTGSLLSITSGLVLRVLIGTWKMWEYVILARGAKQLIYVVCSWICYLLLLDMQFIHSVRVLFASPPRIMTSVDLYTVCSKSKRF